MCGILISQLRDAEDDLTDNISTVNEWATGDPQKRGGEVRPLRSPGGGGEMAILQHRSRLPWASGSADDSKLNALLVKALQAANSAITIGRASLSPRIESPGPRPQVLDR